MELKITNGTGEFSEELVTEETDGMICSRGIRVYSLD